MTPYIPSNYVDRLVEDIKNSKKKSIKLDEPVTIYAEIRTDTDHTIDLDMCEIAVERLSVGKNIFDEDKILIANEEHQITYISRETYDEIQKHLKK